MRDRGVTRHHGGRELRPAGVRFARAALPHLDAGPDGARTRLGPRSPQPGRPRPRHDRIANTARYGRGHGRTRIPVVRGDALHLLWVQPVASAVMNRVAADTST